MAGPADQHTARRARGVAGLGGSAAIIGGYYLVGNDDGDEVGRTGAAPAVEDDDKLDVIDVQPGEPTPGSALAVRYVEGKLARSKAPVRALLSVSTGETTHTVDLEVLERHAGELV